MFGMVASARTQSNLKLSILDNVVQQHVAESSSVCKLHDKLMEQAVMLTGGDASASACTLFHFQGPRPSLHGHTLMKLATASTRYLHVTACDESLRLSSRDTCPYVYMPCM